ncbi:MAG: 50S ribosomal protein L24 [Solirubrobacterales bacterium]|nr:50S ribosomal protein L24 [Solirubrobacterales bacterium]
MAARKAAKAAAPKRNLKIRSGDHVEVVSGKDRGKSGRVLRVDPKRERVVVEGLNMVKRHTRPSQVAGAQSQAQMGGVIERENGIHVSNVMLLDAKGNRTRVRIERDGGKRYRVAKSTGARID